MDGLLTDLKDWLVLLTSLSVVGWRQKVEFFLHPEILRLALKEAKN